MKELKSGQSIQLTDGKTAKVVKELGRGGQGIVYLVELGGKKMALKWYLSPLGSQFYQNLKENIAAGAPSNAFLWPKYLTVVDEGYYGYLMDLRPDGYYEFGRFLLPTLPQGQIFHSFTAMVNAAIKICEGFKFLHLKGYSYQDLNDGNFFINPTTGDVLICDNDNVMPQGTNSGIQGKAHYMAPEVVAGGKPDKYSDRMSLSIILFRIFFLDHPFDGARVSACPCLTDELDRKFYGSEATFMLDPVRKNNGPVKGAHNNVIRRWPVFPQFFKNAFIQEFSEEKLQKNPRSRMLEQQWVSTLMKLRDNIITCPLCGQETLIDGENGKFNCVNCKKPFPAPRTLSFGDRTLYLTPGTGLFFDSDSIADAKVEKSPADVLVKNISNSNWMAETPSGKLKEVKVGESFPARPGIKLTVTVDSNGTRVKTTGKVN